VLIQFFRGKDENGATDKGKNFKYTALILFITMNTGAYSTSGASPITSNEEQGFFKKHKYGLIQTGLITALGGMMYGMFTLMIGQVIVNGSEVYEHHNPRAVEARSQSRRKDVKKDPIITLTDKVEPYMMPIVRAAEAPWRKMGYVMPEHYKAARVKAFQIAGIDENNPLHDKKRFELYGQLGFAVLRDEDGSRGIYIPFKVWKDFVERNSSFRNPEWNQLIEPESKNGGKYTGTLMGKVFHKADSKAQGGNEDGVADNLEWNRALKAMGYTTVDDLVDEIIERVKANSPELKAELRQTVRSVQRSDKVADFDTRFSIRIWESYLQTK